MNYTERVFNTLQRLYVTSEVVSGEMIYSVKFSNKFTKKEVTEGTQAFLDWDDSIETFKVVKTKSKKNWKIVCI